MSDLERRRRLEAAVARALRAADPVAAFAELAGDAELDAELRARIAAADPRGVRVTALLVAKLRFERLMQGSREAADWFERDPAAFTDAFRRYHRRVAPRGRSPREEGVGFERWLESDPASPP